MKLLFDIGNSRVKWALAENDEVGDMRSFSATLLSSDDDTAGLRDQFYEIEQVDDIWISNVGSQSRVAKLKACLEDLFTAPINVVTVSENALGMQNAYLDINQLGVDRWVAAHGARALEPAGDLLVVDIGTAVTIDLVSKVNRFEGGVILPGINLMHSALQGGTAQVKAPIVAQKDIIGRNTEQCVNAGISYGLRGAIESIVRTMSRSVAADDNDPVKMFLTGGGASEMVAEFNFQFVLQPRLVLIGLLALANNPK